MDSLLGLTGNGFVVLAADASSIHSITMLKSDSDKIMPLGKNRAMAITGEAGDTDHFGSYIQKNLNLYDISYESPLSVNASVNFIRSELATALRKHPYNVNILFGGVDGTGAQLYWMDYLGSLSKLNFAAHGYFGHYALAYFDRHWKADMGEEEAIEVLKGCMKEIPERYIINQPLDKFVIKVVREDGVERIVNPFL
ncbi:Proteasome, subunit alpha/beta [Carpediemonas membranifera]|uniref:Proteasome subunit beta n=1 Tax=Carpediemonas membranifera TaxID=201153 RepID=A0A8J6B4P8_9EUKA|nr:Proteasome, subunit alpha/beta [Carpediemonas membranifera]|eukprot:KAG9394264.1 Proteasome, subunit alpha/beta [Carpediemonas membranifera]